MNVSEFSRSAEARAAEFRHKTPMSVRIGHIDVYGHLNNVAVFRLLEQSRIEYTIDAGLGPSGTSWGSFSPASTAVSGRRDFTAMTL